MDVPRLKCFGPGPGPGYDIQAAVPRSAARVQEGRIVWLDEHLARLAESAGACGSSVAWLAQEGPALQSWVSESSTRSTEMLRLRIHGGHLWAALEPLEPLPSPYRLSLMPHPLGEPSLHPLAPHKGLTGAWNGALLLQAREMGADDSVLFWPDGTLAETAIAAIVLETHQGELWLPPAPGRVASLAVRLDLPTWAGVRPIRIRSFTAEDAAQGQLWCLNAVRGIWPGTLLCPKMKPCTSAT